MLIESLLFCLGLLLLIKGGDLFVTASLQLAKRLNLPPIIIGGTLVSIATTMPELVVTISSSLKGSPELAVGNAVGSVIANTGLVVGIVAIICPVVIKDKEFKLPSRLMLLLAVLLFLLLLNKNFSQGKGLLLIGLGLLYLGHDFVKSFSAKNNTFSAGEQSTVKGINSLVKETLFFIIGAALIFGGSQLLITASLAIADYLDLPPLFVGLTIVALGTSLPELITALSCLKKGVTDLSLGNVIGANILGITIITGSAASIKPFSLQGSGELYSLGAMLIFLIMLIIMAKSEQKICRKEGAILILFYFAYIFSSFALRSL